MSSRSIPSVPALSIALGYLPIAPLVIAGAWVWFVGPAWFVLLAGAAMFWSAILFFFLAGVRRGLSFFTADGPRKSQIATMFWLFLLGLAIATVPQATVSAALCVVGFASLVVLDPLAARRGEVPAFFKTLRPPQMALAALAMLSIVIALIA